MSTTVGEAPSGVTAGERWLARLALVTALAAAGVLVSFAGLRSIGLLVIGLAGVTVTVAALWWVLTRRRVLRLLSMLLAVAAPVTVLVTYILGGLLWVVALSYALWALALSAGRSALRQEARPAGMPEHEVPPPRRPFLIMNPRSGGGKVVRFDLRDKAEALGAEVALLDGSRPVDVVALACAAVDAGADLLGVAGGDGTQALVAGVAAQHDIPFLVISAGTRNHFALDLGLDRNDPSTCLDALADGVEIRVDLGFIGGRPFVNNASFGAYAAVVQSPAYRDDKVGTTLEMLPDLLAGHHGPRLSARVAHRTIEGPQAVLVSNNRYGTGDIAGLRRRARLDGGVLGVLGVRVDNAAQAAGLLRRRSGGLVALTAEEVVVDADQPEVPVGVDGEALSLSTPVRCVLAPGALRVRVPRHRPGVPPRKPGVNWRRLRAMALGRT